MSRHTGYAHLPLRPERAPAWLLTRITGVGGQIVVHRSGRNVTDRRYATSTGALKEGIRDIEHDLGVYALGGKGATSPKTPTEILDRCERLAVDPGPLVYASRMAAKVDSAALQDGYQLDHHSFFCSIIGQWLSPDAVMDVVTALRFMADRALERGQRRYLHAVLLSTYERASKDWNAQPSSNDTH